MQLSYKQKTFSELFVPILKYRLNFFNILEEKMVLIAFVFPKLWTLKTWSNKRLKSPV